MQVYNPATNQTAEVLPKSYPMWAKVGWLPVQPADPNAVADKDSAEVTAEVTGRQAHPAARGTRNQ